MQLIPYLNFDGRCREAFAFYARALRGEITMLMTYGESPIAKDVPADSQDHVMHAQLESDGALLMGADGPPSGGRAIGGVHIHLLVDDPAEAERIFGVLSEGANVTVPIAETFFARRFGMLIDRYDKPWMINCLKPREG